MEEAWPWSLTKKLLYHSLISGMHPYLWRRLLPALPLLPPRSWPYQIPGLKPYFSHTEMETSCPWKTRMREPSSRLPLRLRRALASSQIHARRL
ncbi:hypothetical protein ACE6H2_002361 [Prunus campanulata]